MKALLGFLLVFLVAPAQAQDSDAPTSACKFRLREASVSAARIMGPEEIVRIASVLEQPNSPLEILSVDYTGSWFTAMSDSVTHRHCVTIRIRNRSDQRIEGFQVFAGFSSPDHPDAREGFVEKRNIGAGREYELSSCGGGGVLRGESIKPRYAAGVESVSFNDCTYYPSKTDKKSEGLKAQKAASSPPN